MLNRLTLVLVLLLQGCLDSGQRIDRQAGAAHLSRSVVTGSDYRHVVYANDRTGSGVWQHRLVVYLDGDGRPWIDGGRQPATDPTTRAALALHLLMQTPAAGIYVSRPCYQQLNDANCTAAAWTSARYSLAVVASTVAAIRKAADSAGKPQIVLIGYSGGGTLAVLVAEQLEHVAAVITVSANLDTDAWTQHHHYLPLSDSLNPATSSHPHPWPEIHLQGQDDTTVPIRTTANYFVRYPAAQQWQFDHYDHACCWVDAWPTLFARMQNEVH